MKGWMFGLGVAAGIAGIWAAQRSKAQSQGSTALPLAQRTVNKHVANVTARAANAPDDNESIDPKMVIKPKTDIDPKMVIKPKTDIDPKIVVNPSPRKPDIATDTPIREL